MLILIIIQAGSEVVLKTSTYRNKQKFVHATIQSTDLATKAGDIDLGAEFALVRVYKHIMHNEEIVKGLYDCKTIGDAFFDS